MDPAFLDTRFQSRTGYWDLTGGFLNNIGQLEFLPPKKYFYFSGVSPQSHSREQEERRYLNLPLKSEKSTATLL